MNKSILIIDDSEMVRNYHSYILNFFKFKIDTAENGLVAYEKILINEYDLIITDINMPKMNGFELIDKLQENRIDIPIIIVSTEAECEKYNMKNDIYIIKPSEPEVLVKEIQKIFRTT